MMRSDSYRRKKELINIIEKKKNMFDVFGNNSWKMTLRMSELDKKSLSKSKHCVIFRSIPANKTGKFRKD
jgi:hypothetical protein